MNPLRITDMNAWAMSSGVPIRRAGSRSARLLKADQPVLPTQQPARPPRRIERGQVPGRQPIHWPWVVSRAAGARTDAEFDRWVGWANIWALPLGVIGLVLVVLDKIGRRSGDPSEPATPVIRQDVTAKSGGLAQGVIGGDIHNGQQPPAGRDRNKPNN